MHGTLPSAIGDTRLMLEMLGLRFGDILQIIAFLGGGIGFVYTMRGRIDGLSSQVLQQGASLSAVQVELKKIVDVLVIQGRHEERMRAQDERIFAQGQRLDSLQERFNTYIDRGLMPMSHP